jgi:integrase
LRSEEVRELRIEEVGFTGTHTTILVHGKGDKPERVPVPASTASVLEDQIGNRAFGFVFTHGVQTDPYSGPYGQAHDPLPTVFDSEVDDIMSHDQLKRAVTRLSNRAGLNGKGKGGHVTPHCFRHSAITLALDVGVDLRDVEVFARHADGRTTRRYDRTRLNFERHASFALERAVVLQAD